MTIMPAPDLEALVTTWTAAVEASHGLLAGITTETQNEQALALINVLLDHVHEHPELDPLLDVVSSLVEEYETVAYPLDGVPTQDLLAFLMENRDLTSAALAEATRLEVSEIERLLAGEDTWTLTHMRTLGVYFHLRPSVFVPEVH
ncbi:hypothetical protein E7T09_20180 [Deinococcus sp. KSM4-11]|uniref:helix-turn-helix domain-containing protein n=1 Tax=Deinococcus sp. KSM4-11 TaxID=2568654 RepID=UPI0010A32C8E|nr:hypothetical protein [Deinococcus sp. KSM4-11]THF84335.1 hypothetical protein E7T09_20180 [Deinococcus sp. KSM4-11]